MLTAGRTKSEGSKWAGWLPGATVRGWRVPIRTRASFGPTGSSRLFAVRLSSLASAGAPGARYFNSSAKLFAVATELDIGRTAVPRAVSARQPEIAPSLLVSAGRRASFATYVIGLLIEGETTRNSPWPFN